MNMDKDIKKFEEEGLKVKALKRIKYIDSAKQRHDKPALFGLLKPPRHTMEYITFDTTELSNRPWDKYKCVVCGEVKIKEGNWPD